ncbi:MAG: hypothetical protein JWL70_617 [Acidimicrobiia bacterium]|nr:hypothetical protein [Acidimicrobiia bacterium]
MQLPHYLALLHQAQSQLGDALRTVAIAHGDEPGVELICQQLGRQCDDHVRQLQPFLERYGQDTSDEPEQLHSELFKGPRSGPLGLLRDLHDLYLMASNADIAWTLIGQAAQGARDEELLHVVTNCEGDTSLQLRWLRTRMKQSAPQALVVAG